MQQRHKSAITLPLLAEHGFVAAVCGSVLCTLIRQRRARIMSTAMLSAVAWFLHRYVAQASARGALRWAKRQVDEAINRAPSADH